MATCLVVGGAGFIGSHLVAQLHACGREDILVTGRRPEPRYALPDGVRYLQLEDADDATLKAILAQCDEIIDLAYATVPQTSFDDPVLDVLSNLPVTVRLLKLASEGVLRRVVLVSSGGTVYGSAVRLPIDESHPTNPISPYGITKLAIEKYSLMYHALRGLPIVIVRPGNPYGPSQMGNLGQGFVGAAIYATIVSKPVRIFGERGTVRDYIYITDLVEGIVAALDKGAPGEIYNIGTGVGMDNREVLDQIGLRARADGLEPLLVSEPTRPFDVAANVLSSAKLTYISGWRPRFSFEEGLADTWLWARKQYA